MKVFRYIFWITVVILVIVTIAHLTGFATSGSGFQTPQEYETFISRYSFFSSVTRYTLLVAALNAIFGGALFIVRGIRATTSRRRDILIGASLIVCVILGWFLVYVVGGMMTGLSVNS